MPYVDQDARHRLRQDDEPARNAGELNYLLTLHARSADLPTEPDPFMETAFELEIEKFLDYRRAKGNQHQRGRLSYQDFNDVLGAIDGCRREYVRRTGRVGVVTSTLEDVARRLYEGMIAPYEDEKIQKNGDVY